MSRLRVSAISFLNTAPLMWDFDFGELRRDYRVDYTLPSTCAELLKNGMADIGIIPVAAYATIPDLVVIPDVAIASRGPVRSILLIGKVPAEKMTRVAVDTSSRTSVALLRVLSGKLYGVKPDFVPKEPKLKEMLKDCDAALVIGDSALLADTSGYHVRDLAEDWRGLTGKSFVFAFWAARRAALEGHDTARVIGDFQASRDHGLRPANLQRLAKEWSARLGLSEVDITSYLRDNIYYKLDADCLEGLRLFYQYAAACGALPQVPELKFVGGAPSATTQVILSELPPGLIDGLPSEDQAAIAAIVGKPLTLKAYNEGKAELSFEDAAGVIHFIYVDPKYIR